MKTKQRPLPLTKQVPWESRKGEVLLLEVSSLLNYFLENLLKILTRLNFPPCFWSLGLVAIDFSFKFSSIREWRELWEPIREQSEAKSTQSTIPFDTKLKMALLRFSDGLRRAFQTFSLNTTWCRNHNILSLRNVGSSWSRIKRRH